MKNFFTKLIQPVAALLFLAALLATPSARAGVFEPDTIFYGQIINRTSGQMDQLTSGTLTWTIGTPSGTPIVLTTQIHPYNLGQYSYQLMVPHQALAYGLTVASNAIPLTSQLTTYSHLQISVDGAPATILAPGSSTFAVDQSVRGSTYRLDLELGNALASSSGDGIPDWWKAKYGVTDPNADPDHDGWSNLQEFLHGTDPNHDDRIPSLGTTELYVYADATSGIHLQVNDADSAQTQVRLTLTAVPATGTLYLRNTQINPLSPNTNLVVGSSFTADDVNKGRLIYVCNDTNAPAVPTSFSVNLVDENAVHTNTGTVVLNVYRPAYAAAVAQSAEADAAAPVGFADITGLAFYEQQMLINYYLGHDGSYLIWDESRAASAQQLQVPSSGLDQAGYALYVASYGHDHKNVFIGGAGNDRLVGGMENDIFIGGNGADTLRGNGGSDLFVIPGPNSGNDIIEDFSTNDMDVIDISRVLLGGSGLVTNYVQLTNSGTNSYININYAGTGTNFTNMVITLLGTHYSQSDLQTLLNNGNLVTGNKVFSPQVSVVASIPAASQNGPSSGLFTFTRTGPVGSALSANIQITGNAVNGSDYQFISSPVTFAAGQHFATLAIIPYINGNTFTNVVQVTVLAGTGYDLGAATTAQVTIEPLAPQISIEAIESVAVKSDGSAGTFLISRAGIVNNSVLVRLTITGTASNGVDYVSVPTFVNFVPQQTTALINITPKSNANLTNGAKYAQFAIKADPSYKAMAPTSARVILVDQMLDLAAWQQRYFPTNSDNTTAFSMEDPGQTGIRNLFRYAFGLNATAPQNSTGKPSFAMVNGHLSVSFRQPTAVTDVSYTVEVSEDLVHWRSSAGDVQEIAPLQTNDVESVSWQDVNAASTGPKRFMRVRVNQQ